MAKYTHSTLTVYLPLETFLKNAHFRTALKMFQ